MSAITLLSTAGWVEAERRHREGDRPVQAKRGRGRAVACSFRGGKCGAEDEPVVCLFGGPKVRRQCSPPLAQCVVSHSHTASTAAVPELGGRKRPRCWSLMPRLP